MAHELEEAYALTAEEILEAIRKRNRCRVAVNGAVAEHHLAKQLEALLKDRKILGYRETTKDGEPDFEIQTTRGIFDLECKNVLRKARVTRVDFMRTRAPKGWPEGRYYHKQEFQILAACLFNRTERWEYAFCLTEKLNPHPEFGAGGRLSNKVEVPEPLAVPWSADLLDVLQHAKPRDTGALARIRAEKQRHRESHMAEDEIDLYDHEE